MAPKRSQLAQRRKAVGHTQESLAEKLQVDRTTVVRWESGDCEPQPWVRRSLAAALDVTLDRLATLLTLAETSTTHPDPTYRRNHTYYSVHLAEALLRQGDVTEAGAVALGTIPNVTALRSPRTQQSLATLRAQLGRHASRSAVARDFVAAYDTAMAA